MHKLDLVLPEGPTAANVCVCVHAGFGCSCCMRSSANQFQGVQIVSTHTNNVYSDHSHGVWRDQLAAGMNVLLIYVLFGEIDYIKDEKVFRFVASKSSRLPSSGHDSCRASTNDRYLHTQACAHARTNSSARAHAHADAHTPRGRRSHSPPPPHLRHLLKY